MTTLSLALTIMAFAITAYRGTRQAHRVQASKQVKLDYSQRERAFLRALLDVAPNAMMKGMIAGSANNPAEHSWDQIFQDAIDQAQSQVALDPADLATLSISVDAISSNPTDSVFTPSDFIFSPLDGTRRVGSDLDQAVSNEFGISQMRVINTQNIASTFWASNSLTHPIVSRNKVTVNSDLEFTSVPYPEIAFGYSQQGGNFLAKRNWWAFTVNFGAQNESATGIAPAPKTYILSIYEVPNQLAIASSATATSLGQYADGTSWDISRISGSVYAGRAKLSDINDFDSIASRRGIELGGAPAGQQLSLLTSRREHTALASDNSFFRLSSASDSGYVSFIPINRGTDFFDYFAGETTQGLPDPNNPDNINTPSPDVTLTISPTDWNNYSIGATQTAIRVEVAQVSGPADQNPQSILISALDDNGTTVKRQRATQGGSDTDWWRHGSQGQGVNNNPSGNAWPHSPAADDWFIQSEPLIIGSSVSRPSLRLDLEKLNDFLLDVDLDGVEHNNSIWIGPNYTSNEANAPRKSSYPSLDDDTVLVIDGSNDLSSFVNGLTIITPYRIYFADDLNRIPAAVNPPGIVGQWFPPVSIFAPEKRFGIQDSGGTIELTGQVGVLPNSQSVNDVNPLDLRDGRGSFDAASIDATLDAIARPEDVPPINAMNWLTTIEQVR